MQLNRAWIQRHVPHQGAMCLLDEVIDWDLQHIRCRIETHRAAENPLRSQGRLGIACGIEYAAQTMAVHGALANAAPAQAMRTHAGSAQPGPASRSEVGFLAGVREVHFHVQRLDDIEADLICEVTRVAGDGSSALYEFALSESQRVLLRGRATVVLDVKKRLKI
jgi:predicted hotdog family 3-hydroxylacyl-ACP dehydratase